MLEGGQVRVQYREWSGQGIGRFHIKAVNEDDEEVDMVTQANLWNLSAVILSSSAASATLISRMNSSAWLAMSSTRSARGGSRALISAATCCHSDLSSFHTCVAGAAATGS